MLADQPPPKPWISPLSALAVERRYVEAAPFAAGGRRSVLLRSTAREPVRAPCSGAVAFRGSIAGSPPTLTLSCGALRATLRWVQSPLKPQAVVERGDRIGVAAASQLGLSARRPGGAYVDPLPLLGAGRTRSVPPGGLVARSRSHAPRASPGVRRAVAPVHLPATAFAANAGSGAVAAPGTRPGRRHLTGAATAAAERRAAGPVDWPLTVAGVAAVLVASLGSTAMAWRRHRRGRRGPGRAGLAHLVGVRR